jgi:hypothetical protein
MFSSGDVVVEKRKRQRERERERERERNLMGFV